MDYTVKNVGSHRGQPRLYFQSRRLSVHGLTRGTRFRLDPSPHGNAFSIKADPNGDRVVSSKEINGIEVPVIDINSDVALAPIRGLQSVRVVFDQGEIKVSALASELAARERLRRLRMKVDEGTLTMAGVAFGGGILDHSVHAGLEQANVHVRTVLANEIDADLLEHAAGANPVIEARTSLVSAPLQEVVQDEILMSRLPRVEILAAGLPCSGASKSGKSKNGIQIMEQHPEVGHLAASFLMVVHRVQPAVGILENVVDYSTSASAQILRQHLRDMGYTIEEVVLNSADFGSLEARVRWFMVFATRGVHIDLTNLEPAVRPVRRLGDILEPVADDRWSEMRGLKDKEVRDKAAGKGFAMQIVTPDSTRVGTIGKGYAKNRSTEPKVQHPDNPNLLRLLTGDEHARIKEVDPGLICGLSETTKHVILGQGIVPTPVIALARRVGEGILGSVRDAVDATLPTTAGYSLQRAIG